MTQTIGQRLRELIESDVDTASLDLLEDLTATAAEVNKLDGVTATTDELNVLDDIPADVTFAAAAGGANVCEVTLTVVDAAGVAIAEVFNLDVWLSDAATGAGLTGTLASGTVQVKAASGADLEEVTAKKHLRVQTLADGTYVLEITDTAKTQFYVCAKIPGTGKTAISTQLQTADYGS